VSLSVGRGPTFDINLDEPLTDEQLDYLAERDPRYRSELESLGHREPLPDDGTIGATEGYAQLVAPQLVVEAPRLPNMTAS
jgi:hypothetical protein